VLLGSIKVILCIKPLSHTLSKGLQDVQKYGSVLKCGSNSRCYTACLLDGTMFFTKAVLMCWDYVVVMVIW